jgi:cell fate (sporulation/competence/biofilm development) regulator YlbF (YheA/YmcA/DUF963 family)
MPRVNWAISPEAKAIFEAFKREKGCSQDEAAEAMILEFAKLQSKICKKCNGGGYEPTYLNGIEYRCEVCTNCKGLGHL